MGCHVRHNYANQAYVLEYNRSTTNQCDGISCQYLVPSESCQIAMIFSYTIHLKHVEK